MGVIEQPGGGWLSNRIGGRRRRVVVAAFVLVVPPLVGAAVATSVVGFAAALLLAGAGSQLGTGVFYVYVGEVAAAESSGTSHTVLITLSIASSLTAPVTVGWLVKTISWSAAFVFSGLLAVGGIVAVAGLSESWTRL